MKALVVSDNLHLISLQTSLAHCMIEFEPKLIASTHSFQNNSLQKTKLEATVANCNEEPDGVVEVVSL